LNHIRHHTYFKSLYVHIQVFHILHHHTMKLLLAFKSFMPRRHIVEIGSENWFAAGCPIRQQQLFRCRLPNSAAKTVSLQAAISAARTGSLQAAQFDNENCFAAGATYSAANHNFAAANSTSAANRKFAAAHATWQRIVNALQTTQFRQRITIRCKTHNSVANVNSLQPTQFRQRITVSLHNT
jgi:hypothetical protein